MLGDLVVRDDAVDEAVGVEVLRGLHALGERPVVERLVDPRPEEADQRTRLGDGHVAERAPGRHHAAGGRVPQVDEVGQPGLLVRRDRRGDLRPSARTRRCPPASGCRRRPARPAAAAARRSPARRPASAARRRRRRSSRPGTRTRTPRRATRRPRIRASPVSTDSSSPVRSARRPARRRTPRRPDRGPGRCPRTERPVVEHQVDEVGRGQPVAHALDDVSRS